MLGLFIQAFNTSSQSQKPQAVVNTPFEHLLVKYQYRKGDLFNQYGDWFGPKHLSIIKAMPEFQLGWMDLNHRLAANNTAFGNAILAYMYLEATLREIREVRQTHVFIKIPDESGEMRTVDLANRYSEFDELELVFLQEDLIHFLSAHPTDSQLAMTRFLQHNLVVVGSNSQTLITLGLRLKQESAERQIEFLLSRHYDPLYRVFNPLITEDLNTQHLRIALKSLKDEHHVPFSRIAPYSVKTFAQIKSQADKETLIQVYCEFYTEACPTNPAGAYSSPTRSLSSTESK